MAAFGRPRTRRDVQRIDALAWLVVIIVIATLALLIGGGHS